MVLFYFGGETMKELHANHYEILKTTGYTAYHSQGFKGEGMIIAVLDSGIRTTHKEFEDRVIKGRNFVSRGKSNGTAYDINDVEDDNGHGTGVASRAVGKTLGVVPKAKVLVVKCAYDKQDKKCFILTMS